MALNRETFASNLRGLRSRDRLTQEEVAQRVGVSTGSIINYENATSNPSLENAMKLAALFGVTLGDLAGRDESAIRPSVICAVLDEQPDP